MYDQQSDLRRFRAMAESLAQNRAVDTSERS
jgi:hypothetical protein